LLLRLTDISPGAPKKLVTLALKFFLRGFEACNARGDLFALLCKAFLSFRQGHGQPPFDSHPAFI
jgi:hypothetical protein